MISKEQIKQMNALISHRGPDDEGVYSCQNFAFGHRRLSILDLSQDGHQPMGYLDKYVITYNGEVYNYLELREDLVKDGYVFQSNTDTEVILASYDKWGQSCVNKFNGMWAFAIYDKERGVIFCSRDRFGVKPFYYTQVDKQFIFGSEIKQLLLFHEQNVWNKNIIIDYLVTGIQEHTNETFFSGIYKLEQSHNMIYDLKNHTYTVSKYYDIDFKKNNIDINQSIDNYRQELQRAIDLRLRSDVKVGTCLSGGLDSSSIAAIASEKYQVNSSQRFAAIHAKSSEEATDESYYAQLAADKTDLDLNIIEPTQDDFIKNIDEVVYTQEEPFGRPSIFMQYFVMRKAKEIGCTVMLDGQGGDETLLGYEVYYPSIYIDVFRKHGLFRVLKEIKSSNKNNSKMSFVQILKFTIGTFFSYLRKIYYRRRTSFLKSYNNKFVFLDKISEAYKEINKLQKLEILSTNLPALLRYEDKNSMRHSIETRLPFIDYKTLENALSMDVSHKINAGWTKYALRQIVDNKLPEDLVWRKNKLGFNAPDNIWLKGIEEQMQEEIIKSKIIKEISNVDKLLYKFPTLDNGTKWRFYNVAVWERIYQVKLG